ncbi:DUF4097 domain-containing protein [Streptomyces sp. ODS05-4]|uniref:DUF4097 family beta strand repeat-containing protein n=1 Tax=Streptomyces sp. ODS05-4 TaxID=2944939 RepID=UPI00210BEDEB|nr:DUF4097 domain-containing protein [Streptomyces sp. ODS05-4]
MPEWTVSEPVRLSFDDPVTALRVRVVDGAVHVVGAEEGPARLEVSAVGGPPLEVTLADGVLTVAYPDLHWQGLLSWLGGKEPRSAVVSLVVPAGADVSVGYVGAEAVVSGVRGPVTVRGVQGSATLTGISGEVRAETVAGDVEAQAVTGDLRFRSVSGGLTVVEGAGPSVRAESVSGHVVLDLDPAAWAAETPGDVRLNTVSGEVAVRLPSPADAQVEASTAGGSVANAFEDLRVDGQWGMKRITGRLGAGRGVLRATTVSGSLALLRRPEDPETAPDSSFEGKVL